ncbi:MAG: hypothetical protein A2942_03955 [Candidatus Lloydbacteria bacterium RIFCSPLOWO2_01_FULL_50_20]|uniref:Thioredoxin domain-containing protein n=1 Tax=Candidatus Lloydbacteria bacterium RIFCSPLOWO2_01_FULL_50_20 TaxID=1798665 RepID=A0A1G2DJW8_9BACT|nr:MAG: hypothetical protein A3C13_01210 [Candidatus Lloydbacteria bacterium RIFCSPHIGHO2_02_FULL_50_11]OGZ13180.1 MAG: hypothetical protein A2942_03955 [Candidatus Lloydbacteria bacterium RIFCSPLOWO2_01_FULL_50_20]
MALSKRNIIISGLLLLLVIGVIFFVPKKTTNPSELATTDTVPAENADSSSEIPLAEAGGVLGGSKTAVKSAPTPAPLPQSGKMYKDFIRPTGFANTAFLGLLNTEAFTLTQFVGQKVILINFWTTSASNALRMFPYLNAWHTKYKDDGLLIVSIHAPRFLYEQSKSVVDATLFLQNALYPVVLDNNYETWRAYGNTVWPHQYLIDINGRIAYDHPGEGAYTATELKIQELLGERAQKLGLPRETYAPPVPPKDAVSIDLARIKSPETYFGSARNNTLGNAVPLKDGNQDLEYPAIVLPNAPYFNGSWGFSKEYALNLVTGTALRYQYSAKLVHMVLSSEKLIRVKVLRDGAALSIESAGKDVRFEKGESYFFISGTRIYDIVNDQAGYGQHTLEFIIQDSGLKIYTITFG